METSSETGSSSAGRPAQPGGSHPSALGQILIRLGAVDVIDVLLAAYEQDLGDRRRLGQILVERGLVSPEDLDLALMEQDVVGRPAEDSPDSSVEDVPVQPADQAPEPHHLPADALADLPFPTPQSRRLRGFQAVVLLATIGVAMALVATASGGPTVGVTLYGMFVMPYLLIKLVLSLKYRPVRNDAPSDLTVSVIVPFVNEDPATFEKCLAALVGQSHPAEHIYIVDDGSQSRSCYEIARGCAASHPNISVHRFEENRGKRAAQAWAFEQATTPVIATVDSDTILHPDALAEALKPFTDPDVSGVCGYARGTNKKQNLLTRLIDLRYTNSFLYERAAYSVLGSVLCSTGVLSVWRRELVRTHLDDYLNQRFLGTEVHYGDDRRMTAYALRTGKVVLQETAVALTAVPHTMRHFLRQQVRWNKSFFRESFLLIREMRPTRVAWWLGLFELGYWMVLTTLLLYSVVVRPLIHGQPPSWHYLAFVAVMAYARSIRMIGDGGRLFPAAFLLAPLYGFLNLLLLVPLRLYSIVRLRDGSWGTRKRQRAIHRRAVEDEAEAVPTPRPQEDEQHEDVQQEDLRQDLAESAVPETLVDDDLSPSTHELVPAAAPAAVGWIPPLDQACADILPTSSGRGGRSRWGSLSRSSR